MMAMRWLPAAVTATFTAMVVVIAANLLMMQRQQDALSGEIQARAEAVCDGTVHGRANQVIAGEELIAATAPEGAPDENRRRVVAAYRDRLDARFARDLPPQCEGVMTAAQFRDEVYKQVRADEQEAP